MINYNKDVPLFLIEKNVQGALGGDWIVCLDHICGFAGRFIHFDSSEDMLAYSNKKIDSCYPFEQFSNTTRNSNCLLQIEMYLNDFEYSEKNIFSLQRLMKFGMKKYIHA